MRVRAPELQGRAWLNTGGKSLTLADLRGKCCVLDFWKYRSEQRTSGGGGRAPPQHR